MSECLHLYSMYLESNRQCLGELLDHIRIAEKDGRAACLTCYEKLYTECHRSIITRGLIKLAPRIRCVHLRPDST